MLIKELRDLGVGCHVGGLYMGVVVYADDVLLMAPTRGAMQAMLDKCEEYAEAHNIMFSTEKKQNQVHFCVLGQKETGQASPSHPLW